MAEASMVAAEIPFSWVSVVMWYQARLALSQASLVWAEAAAAIARLRLSLVRPYWFARAARDCWRIWQLWLVMAAWAAVWRKDLVLRLGDQRTSSPAAAAAARWVRS